MKAFPILLLLFNFALAEELVFKHKGEGKTVSLSSLKKKHKSESLTINEPHMNVERTYKGLDLKSVLEKEYGKNWSHGIDEVYFTCFDGYVLGVPVAEILKGSPYLTYDRVGGPFEISNEVQNLRKVALGPYYLIWKQSKKDAFNGYWPYQVVSIELVNFEKRFPTLIPVKNSSENVIKGYHAYKKYCLKCHQVNGVGGEQGPELSEVVKVRNKNWIKKYITNPRLVNPDGNMPAMFDRLKEGDKTFGLIYQYLKYQSKQKDH
jgi:mono/diheme cytochrome c family protein